MDNTKMLYKTAKLIRRSIVDFTDEKKKSDMVSILSTTDDSLMRWILVGPEEELQTDMRRRTVDQSALTLSQNVRQVQHQMKQATVTFRTEHARENRQVLGLAQTMHHDTRNKKLIELLHSQNYCVSLVLETAIANAVVKKHTTVPTPVHPTLPQERNVCVICS